MLFALFEPEPVVVVVFEGVVVTELEGEQDEHAIPAVLSASPGLSA